MPRTHEKVSYLPSGKHGAHTPLSAAIGMESALRLLDGRWKLLIMFHLFGRQVQRFSDLERMIDGVSQKMLAQQLRQMEEDGLVVRTVHPKCRLAWSTASRPGAKRCARRSKRC